ncbi:hypothetical protein BIU97_10300 [Curtobacterium sp. MCBA15_009]|uniref:hypothetical protein n=1 Tax=Curtobacterium sp. MCBA15_009 TaxID=1898737 RepID=UPI0008DD9B6E|nr:hypothetical protein [Curtobacterium sp. MCBA15_009]OII10510.1 hypothetical protein BIU97_10300 [Curtobacterium sp. MCBA15_009]
MSTDASHDIDTTDDAAIDMAVTASYARAKLVNAADLVAHVRGLVVPAGAQPSDGQPRASRSEAPLPFRPDPLEASDRVYAHLLNWVRYWSDALQVQPPATASYAWATDAGPQGFRSTVTPVGAYGLTQTLTTWLLLRHDAILRQPDAGDYFTAVDDFLGQLRARFPMRAPRARPTLPRPCPVCATDTMTIERRGEQVTDIALVCGYCAFEGEAKALMKDRGIRSLITDIRIEEAPEPTEWWTKKQATDEMRITLQTLNRYIREDGLATQTRDGSVYVRAGDVRDLWRGKQVQRLATNMRRPVGAQAAPVQGATA